MYNLNFIIMKKIEFIESSIKTMELAGVTRQEIMDFLSRKTEADPETLKAKPFKKKRSKATTKTAGEVPVEETSAEQEILYDIVYADDSISTEHVADKDVKGVIFVLDGRRVFVSARYAPKEMTKKESTEYCALIQVEGHSCTEGDKKDWERGGILYRCYEQINAVMGNLGLELIDDRCIWSSSTYASNGSGYWVVNPVSGNTNYWNNTNLGYVRPVCFWD